MEGLFAWLKYWFAQILELVDSMKAWKEHFFPEATEEETTL